jgi:ribosome-associated protein
LEAVTALVKSRKKLPAKLTRSSKIYKTIINAIQAKKGEDVVSLDLRKVNESVADFFIICSATSTTQIRAIAEHVDVKVNEVLGERPFRKEGLTISQWIIIDYVNIVVHIMQPNTRQFYRLEEMWSDADAQGYSL